MNHRFLLLSFLIFFGIVATGGFALAWEVGWPEIPGTEFVIGDKCPATGCPPDSLPLFIAYLFTFALIAAGMVALLMLVLGAVQYTASAAIPSTRVTARGRMTNAVLGLLLLFGTYVLLNTINPELVMPGLGLSGTIGTEDLTTSPGAEALKEGVEICFDDECANCFKYNYPVENLSEGVEKSIEDQAVAFRILDSGVIVNFWEHREFKGDVVSVEGPTPCLTFKEDVSPPDLTLKVSSINFDYTPAGLVLYAAEGPAGRSQFFEYKDREEKEWEYGGGPKHRITGNGVFYDTGSFIKGSDEGIADDEARYITVPAGDYAILCKDPGFKNCYYILNSSQLNQYGEADFGGAGDFFAPPASLCPIFSAFNGVSSLVIKDSDKECKGVVFYQDPNYNRGAWCNETAAWPVELGNDASEIDKNYTSIDDLFAYDEIDGWAGNHVSSFRLIGNCKMKVCDQANLASPICNIFYKPEKDLSKVCRPFSAICTEDLGAGNICSPIAPAIDCDTGACACCNVQPGEQTCSCCPVPTNWDDVIRSFVICGASDNTTPECTGWVND